MTTAVVTSKGQITIPKPVRDGLGVESGDRVEFVELERGVYTVVAATRDIRDLKGMIPKPAKPVSVENMNRAIRRHAVR
ncbi:MAG: AbrB/MazE/SpoVT family DNA-binding domain-containing protein [Betaproteobacteria bacterium]|nr:AbrB/MazE/SpoVT family DNA-binding domain-containing protein [Betaproteobacteria bacterium]